MNIEPNDQHIFEEREDEHDRIEEARERAHNEAFDEAQEDESWNMDEPEPELDSHSEDPYRDHMKRMLNHGLDWINDNASGTK